MKSDNLSNHMSAVDFELMKREELDLMVEYFDEVPEAYYNFLIWQQVKKAYKQAEDEWRNNQSDSEEMDYLE